METAKLFMNGGSQAVRLPKDCRFEGDKQILIKKLGEVVYLFPEDEAWSMFLSSLDQFTDDFMADGREQPILQERV